MCFRVFLFRLRGERQRGDPAGRAPGGAEARRALTLYPTTVDTDAD